jgi:LmeA-like phospholipid-binding
MRRLILSVVLVVGLLALADRVAAFAAQRVVAQRIQDEQSLAVRPGVAISGFPFLTQLFRGHYTRVDVSVRNLRRGSLDINKVVAHLRGVEVPFSDVVHQHIDRIEVQHATAEVDLDYSDINKLLAGKHLEIRQGANGRAHVSASASLGAAGVHVDGDFPLTVQRSAVVIQLPAGQTIEIPLPSLPFGITLQSASAESRGLVIRCSTSTFILRP